MSADLNKDLFVIFASGPIGEYIFINNLNARQVGLLKVLCGF